MNSSILINNANLFKKLKKNTLKSTLEAKKGPKMGANHRDLF